MKTCATIVIGLWAALSTQVGLADQPAAGPPATAKAAVPSKAVAPPAAKVAVAKAPAAAEPAAAPAGDLTVVRMEVATGIENREPTGAATSFPATQDKVYCFVELKGVPEGASLTFAWSHAGKPVSKTTQGLKQAAKWRTWAKRAIGGKTGEWKVDLEDGAGTTLKSVSFKVE